jgi:hypothetical protein
MIEPRHDPNFLSPAYAFGSAGYLRATAAELALIKAGLPRPHTVRERAIYDTIQYGIENPVAWNRRLHRRTE